MMAKPTAITGRKPFVNDHPLFSWLGQFVSRKSFEHAESIVMRGFFQMKPLRYPPHIQVFHGTRCVGIGCLPTQLMPEVLAWIGDFFVQFGDCKTLLFTVLTAFFYGTIIDVALFLVGFLLDDRIGDNSRGFPCYPHITTLMNNPTLIPFL